MRLQGRLVRLGLLQLADLVPLCHDLGGDRRRGRRLLLRRRRRDRGWGRRRAGGGSGGWDVVLAGLLLVLRLEGEEGVDVRLEGRLVRFGLLQLADLEPLFCY